jgi:hypothetical protein
VLRAHKKRRGDQVAVLESSYFTALGVAIVQCAIESSSSLRNWRSYTRSCPAAKNARVAQLRVMRSHCPPPTLLSTATLVVINGRRNVLSCLQQRSNHPPFTKEGPPQSRLRCLEIISSYLFYTLTSYSNSPFPQFRIPTPRSPSNNITSKLRDKRSRT